MNDLLGIINIARERISNNVSHFKCDTNECKECEYFQICDRFDKILKVVNKSKLSEYDKDNIYHFLAFIKAEYKVGDDIRKNNVKIITPVMCLHKRFEPLNKFNNWDNLNAVLSVEDLEFLKKTINDVVSAINSVFTTIIEDNQKEADNLCKLLNKTVIDYSKMTKEELIELLNR